jgi:chromosomal replication initiation ATPase DnaA
MKPALTPDRLERALTVAAKVFEVSRRELTGHCRVKSVSRARQAAWKALYEVCQTSYPELAWRFKRDHTTIIYGVARADAWAHADPDYDDRVRLIKAAVLIDVIDLRRAA